MGFIDDIMYGVQGESDKDNAKKLERLLTIVEKWREGMEQDSKQVNTS